MSNENIVLDIKPEVMDVSGDDNTLYLEPLLNNFMDDYLRELRFCMPARVVNVQNVEELRIDVQPLNKIRHIDGTVTEMPLISNIPMMTFGTDSSAVLISPKQGQTVLVLYSQLSLDEFKGGSILPYSAESNRKHDLQDAIAIPSIFPFNRSPNQKIRHFTDHSIEDVTVVHNLGTSRENKVILKKSGSISITAPKSVDIDSPMTTVSEDLTVKNLLSVGKDILLAGRSVKTFMDTHDHNYTDDGKPMVSAPPNPTA